MRVCFKKALAGFLAIALLTTLFVFVKGENETDAAGKKEKVVYSLKQLKKVMKTKTAAKITFRTETYDPITIPAVKNAKNKDVVIYAKNAEVTNKAKFNAIYVMDTRGYIENADNNTIYAYEYNLETITVMPGKTVKKLVVMDYEYGRPDLVIRKGAKISNIEFESYGTKSKKDSKTGAVTIVTKNFNIPGNPKTTSSFVFDKNGRLISMDVKEPEGGTVSYTFKYDTNGNLLVEEYSASGDKYTTNYKYDKKDNRIEVSEKNGNGEVLYTNKYEFDSKNRMVKSYNIDSLGNQYYYIANVYDSKGRLIETSSDYTESKDSYTYDSSGRKLTGKESSLYNDKFVIYDETYIYDSNGLLSKVVDNKEPDEICADNYLYDKNGNLIFTAATNEEGLLDYVYRKNIYTVSAYTFEDGFASPVISEDFENDVKAYKKKGYTVVTSAKELIDSIKLGAKIILQPGTYYLSDELDAIWKKEGKKFNSNHKYVEIQEVYNGLQLVIKNVDGLTISGGSDTCTATSIISNVSYADVLGFKNCKNITLHAFKAGHMQTGSCEGNVINLSNCKNTKLYNMDLYGCGVYGISIIDGSKDLAVYNCRIHDCSAGPLYIGICTGKVSLTCCVLDSSYGGGAFVNPNDDFSFVMDRCALGEEESNNLYFIKDYRDVTFKDVVFSQITRYPEYGF